MAAFKLTEKQQEANKTVFSSGAEHVLLEGGSRSAKTFLILRNIVLRSQKAPKSRHAVLRFRFTDVKSSVVFDTFPKVMDLAYPGLKYTINKTDWFCRFENMSEIWFGGLDDKERTEKILGKEYATTFLNECSQISNEARQMVDTRRAQKVSQVVKGLPDKELPLRAYYDCNPPSKAHWCYKLFHGKQDPDSKTPLKSPDNYVFMKINPADNQDNLPQTYLKSLENMSSRYKKRFWYGEYADENPNQLFSDVSIDQYRVTDGAVPEFVRVVVSVDPSGSGDVDNIHNDAIGITGVGLGIDGNAYLLEDNTVKVGPATWGKIATDTYDRLGADVIVGEKNYGGEMVNFTIQTARPNTPFKFVTATRGKAVRAEPIAALYEQGRVRHVGYFPDLEDELQGFSTIGYLGESSPNRADALIWAIAELFPNIVAKPEEPEEYYEETVTSWEAV